MIQAVGGGVIALLLSIIAYFLKLLIQDFKQMNSDMSKVKESVVRLEAEQGLIKLHLQIPHKGIKSKRSQPVA